MSIDTHTEVNVRIEVRVRGKLVHADASHNVFTNTGRVWQAQLYCASDFAADPPTPFLTTRPKYVGVGVGGALQTDTRFSRRQAETRLVTHLEDPVPITISGNARTYLKRVYNQSSNNTLFLPSPYRPSFVVDFAEGEIAFVGNTSRTTGVTVDTSVPVSEFGLYLSDAGTVFTHPAGLIDEVDPLTANGMIAYNIQEPVIITPECSLRVIWELRV